MGKLNIDFNKTFLTNQSLKGKTRFVVLHRLLKKDNHQNQNHVK